ncbi:MAG: hypothetical protein R3C56_15335 [Pirellulaceae bacterium]
MENHPNPGRRSLKAATGAAAATAVFAPRFDILVTVQKGPTNELVSASSELWPLGAHIDIINKFKERDIAQLVAVRRRLSATLRSCQPQGRLDKDVHGARTTARR